ncbi:GNAT family N-acetyltransferase [Dysgonomonas sp. 216]|uniref:GNAT family N-acetyltransferase n=1 Tax=Dysgonomonas sp. 216 TaxID=2302934 RepID=UPI0013CFB33E|nr:GNAT family N-acetyltransferase [Dysgonomonas sp. 216]NDW19051.1 GNAT family N-acetyltransferase [Dysgonomonas sp. 216]
MRFAPQHITLKDEQLVEIREATIQDTPDLLTTIKEYIEDSEFIPYTAGEFSLTIEQGWRWIQSFRNSGNSILLVATHKGQIIGNLDVTASSRNMLSHTAVVGIGILKEWRRIGLGTALFEAATNYVKHNTTLEVLWLQVMGTNEAGMRLYRSFGFEETGRAKGFVRLSDGSYSDDIRMTLNLKQI